MNTHKNISLITSGHSPFDERIFYKFGLTLLNAGYNVSVIASTKQVRATIEGIKVYGFDGSDLPKSQKLIKFNELLKAAKPDLTICSEPLTIIAALKHKKQNSKLKIIYDITEWYPHQNMLNQFLGLKRIFYYLIYTAFNIYVSNRADLLIIGEDLKAKPYKYFAPFKKKKIISYFPSKKYFHYYPPPYNGKTFTICFTGAISQRRGFPRFINLVKLAAGEFPDKLFNVKIIGPFEDEELRDLTNSLSTLSNVFIEHKDWVDYKDFSFELKSADLCIDLRDKNKVYNKSLPIKIFDYIACGKPVIYTKLDSLKDFTDLNKCGTFVENDNLESALLKIKEYLMNPTLLNSESLYARKLFEEKYNWESIENILIELVNHLTTDPCH